MSSSETVHPEVLWAQRSSKTEAPRNIVYLTITAPDVPKADMKLDMQPSRLVFSGKSSTKGVTYACNIEFYADIDPAESKVNHTGRDLEMVLRKKELNDEFWPRLLKDKAKVHWLRTDFDKWVDEDEQDPNDDDDFMNKAGGFGADGGFEGIDFSKFGSGPGGPAGGMPADDGLDDEELDDDEDLPDLEGEETAEGKAGEAAKEGGGDSKVHTGIQEVE